MNLSKEKFLIKRHSERSHAVAKSKNLGRCIIASLVRGVAISCLLFLAACGDDPKVGGTEEDAGIIAIENKTVSGVSQKGPFVNGSSVTVYGLDGETLAQTGNIYEGKIRSDMGDFSVKVVKLASQYALLKANGFYRNEVTGEKSNSQMTLYALTDLSDRDEVNVNLLTHLAYERSLYLATNSMSVASAKAQAEAEVFKSFEIEGDFASAEDLNIFGENDQSAALLAISVMMQGDLKEADFSERLDNYARDIETDGVWDDKNTATFIADWASEKSLSGGLASVRANVEKWGQLFGVPPFEKYVNNFWWQNYGLGTCDAKREGEVKINSNALSEKNGIDFICDNSAWRIATDLDKDTYKWKAGKDADVKTGDVNKSNCYVFEDKAWRLGNTSDCSLKIRGCTKLRQDTVGQGADKAWYTCDNRTWREATDNEKDTYKLGTCKDNETKNGNVSKLPYFCVSGQWVALDIVAMSEKFVCGDMWCANEYSNNKASDYRVQTGLDGPEHNSGYWLYFDDNGNGGQSRITWPTAKGNAYWDDALDPVIDVCRGVCARISLDKGTLNTKIPYVGVYFDVVGDTPAVGDATAWGGICVVYSSSIDIALELAYGNVNDASLNDDLPQVKLPLGKNVVKNFSWDEFTQLGQMKTITGSEAAQKLASIRFTMRGDGGDYFFNIHSVGTYGSCKKNP